MVSSWPSRWRAVTSRTGIQPESVQWEYPPLKTITGSSPPGSSYVTSYPSSRLSLFGHRAAPVLGERLEPFAQLGGDRTRAAGLRIDHDLHRLPAPDQPVALLVEHLVVQHERGCPDLRQPHFDSDYLPEHRRRHIVALGSRHDEVEHVVGVVVMELLPVGRPCHLEVGEVDRVVDVAHGVQVSEPDRDLDVEPAGRGMLAHGAAKLARRPRNPPRA